MVKIIEEYNSSFSDFLRDESCCTGNAGYIAFPQNNAEVVEVLMFAQENTLSVTIQGSRTGITGGAVPFGGVVINLSKMNAITGLRYDIGKDCFFVNVQPGVLLSQLRSKLSRFDFDVVGWSPESLDALKLLKESGSYFFPPDPTETSASIGGMTACSASGACSFYYGSVRGYIQSLKAVLADGSGIYLERGRYRTEGRAFCIVTDARKEIKGVLPDYIMPDVKNAAGYFSSENMDLIDLIIGSEGTLCVITDIELKLIKSPGSKWGMIIFFPSGDSAIRYVRAVRGEEVSGITTNAVKKPAAIEYFNSNALDLLRRNRENNTSLADMPPIPPEFHTAIYIEYHGRNEEETSDSMMEAASLITLCSGCDDWTWIASNSLEMEKMHLFRHAVPELVNKAVSEYKKEYPDLTKLGTDMAVPDKELDNVIELYNRGLDQSGLDSVMFGHIGNNHIHVNIIPHNMQEYQMGKQLYAGWARSIIQMGGTISAEHGVGKLKIQMLKEMYGENAIQQMRGLKRAFDPENVLNRGNLL